MPSPKPIWLNLTQLGAYLGVHVNTIRRMMKDAELPPHHKVRRCYRFERSTIDRWIDLGMPGQDEFEKLLETDRRFKAKSKKSA